MSDFIRGWNAAIDAAVKHCEEVRQDRAANPPDLPGQNKRFTADDIVKLERAAAGSCKIRIESMRKPEQAETPPRPRPGGGCCPEWMRTGRHG